MFKAQRHNEILNIIRKAGSVSVTGLAKIMEVALLTIRRDLDELCEKGLVVREHGGAMLKTEKPMTMVVFTERVKLNYDKKESIAKIAARLVKKGETVIMDAGTTNALVAGELKKAEGLNVVTNFLNAAVELCGTHKVFLLSGSVKKNSLATVGNTVIKELQGFRAHKCFISIDGIDPKEGFTTTEYDEADIKRTMIERTRETIIVADSSKIGVVNAFKVLPISAVNKLITDSGITSAAKKALEKQGIEVIIAK